MGFDFRAAYVPHSPFTGEGQVVGLLEFDGYTASDITDYEAEAGLPNVPVQNILLDGADGSPSYTGGEVEVSLDIEMAMSMAPCLSSIVVYDAGLSGNFDDILSEMAYPTQGEPLPLQIGCSWYTPGGGPDSIADGLFKEFGAQGQSFFAASGDIDAYTGPIPFPSDNPYITIVGGTTLSTAGQGGPRISEYVWNWEDGSGQNIGSSGGISTYYTIPSWQAQVGMTANLGSIKMRNIPDVALTADQVDVRCNGFDQEVGGTSCAAPLWAGIAALVNSARTMNGNPPVGFLNPALYAIGRGAGYMTQFNDITVGNNEWPGSPIDFYAVPGFDLCTGWGTPTANLIGTLAGPSPTITTVAGNYYNNEADGWLTYTGDGWVATDAGLGFTSGVAVDASGNLYIACTCAGVIRKVNTEGVITTVVGNSNRNETYWGDGGAATDAGLDAPSGVAVDGAGNLYIADSGNGVIRKVNTHGIITTVAGDYDLGGTYSGDGGAATDAGLNVPSGIAVDASGNLYIADTGNNVIRMVDASGNISTVAGNYSLGGTYYGGNGSAAIYNGLNSPTGVAVDASGNLYIADSGNNVIRMVDVSGDMSTVAGDYDLGGTYSGDGFAAVNAGLNGPTWVTVDASGNLYIADYFNNVVRRVDTSGIIMPVAGNYYLGGIFGGYSGDGGPATDALLSQPCCVVADASGNLFIDDFNNYVVRKVTPHH